MKSEQDEDSRAMEEQSEAKAARLEQEEARAMELEQEEENIDTLEMVERAKTRPFWRLTMVESLFYGLIILAVIGAAISRTSIELGQIYWLSMIPLIAAGSLYVEWAGARGKGIRWTTLLRTQLLHWASLIVAIELVYVLFGLGQIDRETIGAVVLLLVAQTTFTVGVYVDWRFSVVGLFLAGCLVVIAYLQIYIWLILLIALGIILLAMYLHRRFNL